MFIGQVNLTWALQEHNKERANIYKVIGMVLKAELEVEGTKM